MFRYIITGALFLLMCTVTCRADELEDAYANLKAAVEKKDPDLVKKYAMETSQLARKITESPQPTAADEVEIWKQRVEYAKGIDTYSEYALFTAAAQQIDPKKVIDLVDTLEAQNPKSQYLGNIWGYYFTALSKTGAESKVLPAAERAVKNDPGNPDALLILSDNLMGKQPGPALRYAEKLISVLAGKPPEGTNAANWDRVRGIGLAHAHYTAGVIHATQNRFVDADQHLRLALPLVKGDSYRTAGALFYLGLVNYNLARATLDKPRMNEALKFSDESAKIAGPFQSMAKQNAYAIRETIRTGR